MHVEIRHAIVQRTTTSSTGNSAEQLGSLVNIQYTGVVSTETHIRVYHISLPSLPLLTLSKPMRERLSWFLAVRRC